MLSPEEIDEQQQLLATYRRTLAVYLRQQADIGLSYSPPALINGIADTRESIRRIKTVLTEAGAVVAQDPDDDEPPPPPVRILPARPAGSPAWLLPAGVVVLAIVLIAGVVWGMNSRAEQPLVEENPPSGQVDAPSGQSGAAELEQQLANINMELSGSQADTVRSYMTDSSTGYWQLAEHVLGIVGSQRFRQPIYLDELDTKYAELVGEANYSDFDPDRLREAMVAAWNNHYPDDPVDAYDQIVE